ncbi:MAG TPA: DNA translocase FtsK 4TM domain-containing protein, partial [Rhodocyclaceae bacterium]|nr:DNA translocase FtsK 4TM domain-containing protein [Rhodocyclaceae bacterium]
MTDRASAQPLPEKIAALLHEARWLAVAATALFLGLILWGYNGADPGWSHAAHADGIANPGGRFGAWLADLLLYLLGLSAWWLVLFLAFLVVWGYHRMEALLGRDRRPFFIALTGFLVVLTASAGVEHLRFWSLKTALPLAPGGIVGAEVGHLVEVFLGFTGGTLVLLALLGTGLSLFLGFSWLTAAEKLGGLLEAAWSGAF